MQSHINPGESWDLRGKPCEEWMASGEEKSRIYDPRGQSIAEEE